MPLYDIQRQTISDNGYINVNIIVNHNAHHQVRFQLIQFG